MTIVVCLFIMLTAPPSQRVSSQWLIGGLAVAFVATLAAAAFGGEPRRVSLIGAEFGPLILLCALAQLAQRHAWIRIAGWVWFAALLVMLAVVSIGLTALALPDFQARSMPLDTSLTILGIFGGAILLMVLTAVVLATGTWVWLGRRLGATVDAHNMGHAQGVAGALFWVVVASAPLVILHGQPPLLVAIAQSDITTDGSDLEQSLDLLWVLLWMVPVALVGAGYPLQRSFRATLGRLGVTGLRRGELVRIFTVGLGLVAVGMLVGAATSALWAFFGWPTTDDALVQRLFGAPVTSPLGILIVGLSAGVGEELVTRGLLQPRLGWFLPNLAFAAAHAFQYGPDGLLVVFVVGAVLAFVRHRWNTTASILAHMTYDVVLLLAALLGAPGT